MFASVAVQPVVAATGINKQINFQGKVTNPNGTNVPNGTYNMQFKMYTGGDGCVSGGSSPCSGTNVWTESRLRNATQGVTVTDGIFQVNLGSITALPASFNDDTVWMSINLGNTNATCTPFSNCVADGEMLPFIRFTAAPYALNSDLLDGLDASAFAQLNPGSAQSGSLNVTGSVQAATSLQAPLVDNAGTLGVGTGATTTGVTVGRATSTTNLTLNGSASTSWNATGASGTTTVNFAAPTTTNTITFPNASGTVCTTTASTCSATYQAAGSYLAKNAQDTSVATVAGTLLALTNSDTGSSASVLALTNAGTNSALKVTQSANPAAGQALILANNTHGTPTGNLLDLQVSAVSKLSVDVDGDVTQASGATVNGQTISAAASFTGTVTAATSLIAPLVQSADGGGNSAALSIRSGNASGNSGNVSIDSGTASGSTGTVSIGTTNASAVTVGRSAVNFLLQGAAGASGSLVAVTGGGFTTNVRFTTPTANTTLNFPASAAGTYTVCTTDSTTCGSVYNAAGNYLQRNAADTSTFSVVGDLLAFSNPNTGAASALDLSSAGTDATLSVTGSGNPSAGQATLLVNNSNGTPSGNLLDLQTGGTSRLAVSAAGALTQSGGAVSLTGGTSGNALTVSNSTSTGDILNLKDNATTVLQVKDAGSIFVQPSTNSNFAFEMKEAAGGRIMRIDSSAQRVAIGAYSLTAADNIAGQFQVIPTNDNRVGITVTGSSATQAADYYVAVNPTSGNIFRVQSSGDIQTASGVFMSNSQSAASTNSSATSFKSGDVSGATSASGASSFGSGNSTTSGNTGAVTLKSGVATSGNSGSVTVDSGVASGTGGAVFLGNTNASAVTLGRADSGVNLTLQGSASTTWSATGASGVTTVGFAAPTTTNAITFANAGGTVCTTVTSTCSAAYQVAGTAFVQGGNSFGAAGNLGTNDGNALNFRTNNATRLTLSTAGDLQFAAGGGRTIDMATAAASTAGDALTIQAGTGGSGAGSVGGLLKLQGGSAGGTSANGGNVSIVGGNGVAGGGSSGSVIIDSGAGGQGGGAINIGTVNSGTIAIGGAGTSALITVGQATGSSTVNIGSANRTNGTQTISMGGGTSTTSGGVIVNIANGVPGASTTNTVAIGTAGTTTGTVGVTLGSAGAAAHTTVIQGGNGTGASAAIRLSPAAAGDINIGTTTQTGTIRVGQANATNTIDIGTVARTSATQSITIGNGTSATSGGVNVQIANGVPGASTTNTVAIGTAGTTTGTVGVTLGSAGAAAHTTVIQGGTGTATGDINIGDQTTAGKIIDIGSVTNAGTSTVNIATAAAVQTVAIGSANSTSTTTLNAGSGNINLNAAAIATNQTTVALLNATATTVNAFGAATAINLGAASSIVTLGNGGAATLRSTTGALTVTSAAAATWSTAVGNLTVDSAATLNLGTSTATGVVVGGGAGTFSLQTANIDISTAGAITDATGIAMASGNFVQAGAGTFGTGTGAVSLNGDTTVASGKTLTAPTATFTGANALTLGTASTNTGSILFRGSGGAGTLALAGPNTPNVGNFTLSLPVITANATVCSTNAVCTGYAPANGTTGTGYIWNTTTQQTANMNIVSASAGSIGAIIQGVTDQTQPSLAVRAGSSPDVAAFQVQNSDGSSTSFSVNPSNSRAIVGNDSNDNCTGRLCVVQASTGVGSGATATNIYNYQTASLSSGTGTYVGQNIIINDTSTALANTVKPLVLDASGTTNTSATINSIFADIPTNAAGNFLQMQNGSTNIFTLSNSGSVSHVSTGTASMYDLDIMNTSGTMATAMRIDRNAAGGTTTNALEIENTAGTLTNGLAFTGTIGTDINRASGILSLQGTGGVTITGAGTTTVSMDTAGAGTVNLGNTNATTINLGTSNIAHAINLGNTGATGVQAIRVGGNGNTGNTVTLDGGTAAAAIQIGNSTTAHGIQIGSNATGDNDILMGGANAGSTLLFEAGTGAAAIQIGNGATAHGIQIGTGAAAQTIVIGSTNTSSTTTVQGGNGVSITTNSASAGTIVKSLVNSATAFQVQNSGNTPLLTADTANTVVKVGTTGSATMASVTLLATYAEATTNLRVGDGTDGMDFLKATGPIYRGTARPTKRVTLAPEFPGATMTADGSSNSGTMTSDFCSASTRRNINIAFCPSTANSDEHNYYKWNAASAAANDYDIWVRYQVPSDFSAFASDTTINMFGYRTSATESVQLAMYQANGTQCGTTTTVTTANTSWTETALGGTETSCTVAAGDIINFRVIVTSAIPANSALAGEIRFDYLSKF